MFGASSAYKLSSFYEGGIRESYLAKFIRYGIKDRLNLSWNEFIHQRASEALQQLDVAKRIYDADQEEKRKALQRSEEERKKLK